MTEPLLTRYRPKKFDEVLGQDHVIKSLLATISRGDAQSFLFSGPAGVGKTTMARIAAKTCGCLSNSIREVRAAEYTGVDAMRDLISTLQYEPFGKSKGIAVILDECHRLSGQAWDCLLKVMEEPPAHLFWFLCTTEVGKVPNTIKTRCASYTLNLVPDDKLDLLLYKVCHDEKIDIDETVADLCIKEAHGSPRQLLTNLAVARDAQSKKEAAALLRSAIESDATRQLCQFLLQPGSWAKAMALVDKLEETSPESVRIVVCNYMASVLKSSKSDRQAILPLKVLEAFSGGPWNPSEKTAPILLAVGRIMFADE